MITRDDLESLSSHQLHDRAVDMGKAEGDIDWLWGLLGSIPAAEGQLGELDDSGLDISHIVSAINGYVRADRSTEETLRPQYVDYLLEHLETSCHQG
ncbi:MAG TPA: hypothetical protein VFI59_06790 [Actinomycetota bacterium]|nr:hypothetical protein [Actinomycetota bacterium]